MQRAEQAGGYADGPWVVVPGQVRARPDLLEQQRAVIEVGVDEACGRARAGPGGEGGRLGCHLLRRHGQLDDHLRAVGCRAADHLGAEPASELIAGLQMPPADGGLQPAVEVHLRKYPTGPDRSRSSVFWAAEPAGRLLTSGFVWD